MKILITSVLTTLVAGSVILDARADITTGLVGYWSLAAGPSNSTVADLSGNGNTGTLVNFSDGTFNNMWTTNTDPTNGWPYAMLFNQAGEGTDTYVSIPNSPTLDQPAANKAWSISAWVNCSVAGASEGTAGIVTKGVSSTSSSSTAYSYDLYMSGGKFTAAFRNSPNTGGTSGTSTTVAAANTWYHVVAVVHEGGITVPPSTANSEVWIYVNGVQQYGTNSNTYTTMLTNAEPVTIGCFGPGLNPFQGTIDEVRIYNKELDATDVLQLYQNRANTLVNTGIGYWNGLAGSGGNGTLDTTSANFCANLASSPLGTPVSLTTLLSDESSDTPVVPPSIAFSDYYYSNNAPIAVTSTNITIASGGVAIGDSSGPGTNYFVNTALTYLLQSSDSVGLKDGASPTALAQLGLGTVILTGINTFSGGTTISSIMQLGNGGATGSPLSSGPVTINAGGVLVFDGNDNPTFNNVISGSGSVTQEGSGTLTLGTGNNYSGTTTITGGGTLSVPSMADGNSSIGTSSLILNSGTLAYTGTSDTTVRSVTAAAGNSGTINVPAGATLTLTGVANGTTPGSIVTKTGTGTLIIGQPGTASSSYFGMNINAGVVQLDKTSQSIGFTTTVNSGGTLQLVQTGTIYSGSTSPITVNSGGIFDLDGAGNTLYSLSLSGAGTGGGALSNSAVGSSSTLTCPITLAANTTIGGAGNITLPGAIGGPGSLTYAGVNGAASTTLELQNSTNTYAGGTFVTGGVLDANVPDSIPGNVTVSAGATLELDSAYAMSPTATITLASSTATNYLDFSGTEVVAGLIIGGVPQPSGLYGMGNINPNGQFTGGGVINVVVPYWDANGTDAGSSSSANGGGSGNWDNTTADWWVSGNSDMSWPANDVAYFAGQSGTVTVGGGAPVNVLGLVFSTANYSVTNSDGNPNSVISLTGNNPIISVPAGTTAIGCDITGGGSAMGLTVSGPGTLILGGTNSYSDGTEITGGATVDVQSISDSGTSAIANSGNLTLSGGTLAYTGNNTAPTTARTISAVVSTTNDIDVPGGVTLTLSGSVDGATAAVINKTDSGTLVLGGTTDNTSLDMNINGGEVIIAKTSASGVHGLGGGASSVGNGATLQLAAGSGNYDLYSGCVLTVNSGGVLDMDGQSDDFSTLTLSGVGPVGATYLGALINSLVGTTSVLSNSGAVLAANTTIGGPGSNTLNCPVSGSGTLTYAGTGTLTLTNANTYSGGTIINSGSTVLLTNSISAGGTGAISVAGTLNLASTGNNTGPTNTISGAGTINIIETANDNFQLSGVMSGFTGVLNCPTDPSGTAKVQLVTANVALPASATINLLSGGTLFVGGAGVVIPCPVNVYGVGNTEAFGALRLQSNCLISGPVTLYGSTTMGNGVASNSLEATISGPISQSGGSYGISFANQPGTIVLSGSNTFTGPIIISNGEVIIGGSGSLGYVGPGANYTNTISNSAALVYNSTVAQTFSGPISGSGQLGQFGPGTLTLTSTNSYTGATTVTNGCTLAISGAGSLGYSNAVNSYAGLITNLGTFNYNSSLAQTLSGTIYGTGTLVQNGSGTLTLTGGNLYTGGTTVNAGTLALGAGGSFADTASITIAGGATFDPSVYTSYTIPSTTTLIASGTGIAVGTTAAAIKGGSGSSTLSINGPVVLGYTPQTFTGDTTHPALYISQGNTLNFSASSLTVSNASGTPLGAGTYTIVQTVDATINSTVSSVTVTGKGLAANSSASISIVGGNINMVVTSSGPPPQPVITTVGYSGGNVVLSGTNGPDSGGFHVLTSTNLITWVTNSAGTFSGTGTFSVTNAPSGTPTYYIIKVP